MSPSTRAVLGMVVLAACVRSVASTTADAGFDAGMDVGTDAGFDAGPEAEFDIGTEVALPVDRPIGDFDAGVSDVSFPAERPADAAPMDVPVPDKDAATGGMCRGYVPNRFCTGGCGACVNAAATGDCRAEHDALESDPQCMFNGYGFSLCFPSCVLNTDAGAFRCIDDYSARVRGCACYDRCVGMLSPVCQPRRRAFDRCVVEHCAACRS